MSKHRYIFKKCLRKHLWFPATTGPYYHVLIIKINFRKAVFNTYLSANKTYLLYVKYLANFRPISSLFVFVIGVRT